jgi:hypothetical protein
MWDEIDIELLQQCNQNPSQPLADSVKPLLGKRSRRRLYYRLFVLEAQQLIAVDRSSEKGVALATITEKGKAAITGREDIAPQTGARSS